MREKVSPARLLVVAGLTLALVTASCSSDGDSEQSGEEGTLIVATTTGSYARAKLAAYVYPFEAATGIEVQLLEQGDNPIAAISQQVESGNVIWDVIGCGRSQAVANKELFEPIDTNIVVSDDDLITPDMLGDVYVVDHVEAFPLIAYSTEAYSGGGPVDWADFFDVAAFPGPRGVPNVGLDSAWIMPAVALMADGVAPEDLIPFDLDRAYAKLDELKPDIRVFWTGFAQSQDILRAGEVDMNIMTDGRALQLADAGEPVAVSFDQAFQYSGAECVVKGAPNAENGFKYLEFILSHPKQQAIITQETFYGPPTNQGIEEAHALGVPDFSSMHVDELIPESQEFLDYVSDNSDELLDRWNTFAGA